MASIRANWHVALSLMAGICAVEPPAQRRLGDRELARADDLQGQKEKAAAQFKRVCEAPVGIGSQSLILWKPGVNPTASYSRAISSVKLRRAVVVTTGIAVSLIVPIIAILLIGAAFHVGIWLGVLAILTGIVIVPPALAVTWEGINKTRVNEVAKFNNWVKGIHGQECFVVSIPGSGMQRLALAVKTIQDSYAIRTGWLSEDVLIRAHEDAWNSTLRANSASTEGREVYLGEVATSLESAASDVAKLDAELRSREKSDELQRLQEDYAPIKDRARALSEEVKGIRQFLAENPE